MLRLTDSDRPKGVLTSKDRRYLFGEIDMSSYDNPRNVIKQRRYRMRRRIEHALLDLVVANNLLSMSDQARVFDSLQGSMERNQFEHVVSEIFDFLYSNLSVGHRNSCASLGIAKSYHLRGLIGTGGTFDFRPKIKIEEQGTRSPAEFDHTADIARYHADIERLAGAQPNPPRPLSEMPENPPENEDLPDLYAPQLETRGFDLEDVNHDNRKNVYQRRLDFIQLLDEWPI